MRVFRLDMGRDATRPQSRVWRFPDKPSIAALPFQNMSGEPDQDYFADGMVEDIVTGLLRSNGYS